MVEMIPCNPVNYGAYRAGPVKYLVIHYTAGHNDTARNNGKYFARANVGASAHYFVDANEVIQSVPDNRIAWHCGGSYYYHPECRNHNAIGIEICTRYQDGQYSFDPAAVERAAQLTMDLMQQYHIDADHVVRHFDVTHKICPAPMCGEHHGAWLEFKEAIMRYQTIDEIPEWGKATVQKLLDKGILNGTDNGLDLSRDMLRMMVYNDRAGVYG